MITMVFAGFAICSGVGAAVMRRRALGRQAARRDHRAAAATIAVAARAGRGLARHRLGLLERPAEGRTLLAREREARAGGRHREDAAVGAALGARGGARRGAVGPARPRSPRGPRA
jgi:hypothetical protein